MSAQPREVEEDGVRSSGDAGVGGRPARGGVACAAGSNAGAGGGFGAGSNARSAASEQGVSLFELVVLALGFGLCRVWVVGSMGIAAAYDMGPGWLFQYDQVFLLAGAAVTCLVAVLAPRLFSTPEALARLNASSFGLIAASIAVLGAAYVTQATPILTCAFALAGAGSGVLQVMWGERFVRHGVRAALLAAPASAIVTALVMMALPDAATRAAVYVAPLLSLGLLCARRGEGGSLVLNLRPSPVAAPARACTAGRPSPVSNVTLARLMASVAVFSLVGRCLDSFPAGDAETSPAFFADHYAFLAILLVGVLFVALVLALGKRIDTMLVYRLSLPIMVAGFVILTLFTDQLTLVSVFVITVGYEFFDVLFWAMLVGVARSSGRAAVPTFGWGVACTYAGMALGTLLSRAAVGPIASGKLDLSAFSLLSILVLVLLVVLVLPEGTFSKFGSGGRARAVAPADDFALRCDTVGTRYELTPRERDVLALIARGRTLSVIARELHIAEGTARTHMGHIYAKLGVHKQQELIDLVEREEPPEE